MPYGPKRDRLEMSPELQLSFGFLAFSKTSGTKLAYFGKIRCWWGRIGLNLCLNFTIQFHALALLQHSDGGMGVASVAKWRCLHYFLQLLFSLCSSIVQSLDTKMAVFPVHPPFLFSVSQCCFEFLP